MHKPPPRTVVPALSLALASLAASAPALAQRAPADEPSAAALLAALARPPREPCAERCYTLEQLSLTGSLREGRLRFELRGAVLAEHPVAVPLFGPVGQVRIEEAREGNEPATLGFDGDRYFLHTSARRFVLTGALVLQGDRALTLAGPLNTLRAELRDGRVVEGSALSGLVNTTVHFDEGERATPDAAARAPEVFELARAVRVDREVRFEYRLALRSGGDLGVVRLPLAHGERVLSVQGSTGWRVEGGALVLPTAGRSAEITVSGTLPRVPEAFTVDPRSRDEWWLFEGDAEHRLVVETPARQVDASTSPLARTQPSARLFLATPGQTLRLRVQALTAVEALAAVARTHERRVVVTRTGEVLADDRLSYDNNGIDYLAFTPNGRALYAGTDGVGERLLHGDDPATLLLPLRTGAHEVRVQSLTSRALGLFGGRLELPAPTVPLTVTEATLTVGLPSHLHALALTGGDRTRWGFGRADALALLAGCALASLALRGRGQRIAGSVALGGLWALSPGVFSLVSGGLVVGAAAWLARRALRGPARTIVPAVVTGVGAVCVLGASALVAATSGGAMSGLEARSTGASALVVDELTRSRSTTRLADDNRRGSVRDGDDRNSNDRASNLLNNTYAALRSEGQQAGELTLAGVTPVALTLPTTAHTLRVTRQLVTPQRGFRASVYYVTDLGLLPALAGWLGALAFLLHSHRAPLRAAYARLRLRLRSSDEGLAPEGTTAGA